MDPDPIDRLAALHAAIATLQAQRALLGAEVVDTAVQALRLQLDALPASPGAQQLKQATLLFADVVGSTQLAQRLGPEDVHAVMDGALARFTAIVQAHQGQVLQYAGDNVLAIFGMPSAQEDDAEHAVHAALALCAEGRRLAARMQERHGLEGFDVRVGLHTGEVLVGGGVDGDHSVRGAAVPVAARMEQTAPPGQVRISVYTWRLVRGGFDCEEQPPLHVKGLAEPVRTWLVRGVQRAGTLAARRGVEGLATPLVGREAELRALDEALAAPGLRLVTVVAEAGLGKTRLAEAWCCAARAAGALHVLQAQGSESSQARPYRGLRDWLTFGMAVLPGETAEQTRARWLAACAPRLANEADAAVLGHLIGFDFSDHPELRALLGQPRQLRDRAFFHARQWLRALGPAPPVLLLDDAHWADDGTLDFVETLATAADAVPAMLLCLARPQLLTRRPAWGQAFGVQRRLALAALDESQTHRLAAALLQRLPEGAESLRGLLVEQSGGNPFYLEELLNVLIDRGVVTVTAAGWHYEPKRLGALRLPQTLLGVLQARMDALPDAARHTAQMAAVVGTRFWDGALETLGAPLPHGLQVLVEREFVQWCPDSRMAGLTEYAFHHQLQQQVGYDSVLRRDRTRWHAQMAQWLQAQPGEPALELVAEHLERGGEAAAAGVQWQRAAESAATRYANPQALSAIARAQALAAGSDLHAHYGLQLLRCKLLNVTGDRDALACDLDTLNALAVQRGDAEGQSDALRRIASNRFETGQLASALETARRAVACAPDSAPARQAFARALLGQCLVRTGQRDAARHEFGLALQLARQANDPETEAVVLNDLGSLADDEGRTTAAIGYFEQALALHRASGDRLNESGLLNNLAYAMMKLGDYERASRQYTEAIELMVRIGARHNEGIAWINLGMTCLNLGDGLAAEAQDGRAIALLQAARDRWSEAAAVRLQGQSALMQGRLDGARDCFLASSAMLLEMGSASPALESLAGLAEADLARGDLPGALASVEQLLAQEAAGVSLDGVEEPMRVRWVCWRVLCAVGDARAQPLLESALEDLARQARRIDDERLRDSFLRRVPAHQALLAAGAPP
jgi:class 3 adenylate cyclase/predicted ATPase